MLIAWSVSSCSPPPPPIPEAGFRAALVGTWQGTVGDMKETVSFRADDTFVAQLRPRGFISNTLSQGVTGTIHGTWSINGNVIAMKVLKAENEIRVICTRHGEKLYETLLNREEMVQAEDLGDYYRVPADARDLNYSSFFSKGKTEVSEAADYNSHNTELLDVDAMMNLLLKLECVQDAMKGKAVLV